MRLQVRIFLLILLVLLLRVPRAAAYDWAPVTDAEKNMKSSPIDPGAGAVVLFKRGELTVLEPQSLRWTTNIHTYTRIKIFTEAGREAANVSVDTPKFVRLSKIEGHTILPSGQIIPLDATQVFRGRAYEAGKNYAIMKTSFTFPSVEPGAILEYETEEYVDWFFPPPWFFDTANVGTLQSSLKVTIGPRLGMSQLPLDTNLNKISMTRVHTVQGEQFEFTAQNLRPIQREPYALPFRDQAVSVLFNPVELSFNGQLFPIIKDWNDVATEVTQQVTNMNKSNKEARNKAKELAEKLPEGRGRAEAIYKFIQQNITSSNLAGMYLGRTADDVITSKRGDPDEINALFVSMLKDEKVDADMVLVATHNWETLARQFPNLAQFSRIISRIYLKEGAVFADPADPAAPFGELPSFERDLVGLAVKGSKVQEVTIPMGVLDDNLSATKVSFQVGRDWKTEGDAEIDLKGAEAINLRGDLLELAPEKVEQQLTDYLSFGHGDSTVSGIAHPDLRDTSQQFVIKAHLKDKLTDESGPGELLVNPWLDNLSKYSIFKTNERHSSVRFDNPVKQVSTSTWQLAPEIKVGQLPKEVKLENDLGGFSHSCAQNGNTVTCTRTFYLKKITVVNTTEYLNARKFFDDIAKSDQEVIVLRGL